MIIKGGICLDGLKEIPDDYKEYITIGKDVIIMTGTILASNGFGFTRDEQGVLHHREHNFGVVIEDGVWIGNNCTIDRGRWRDTAVNRGSKLDNNVHIGHNAVIGKNSLLCAGVIVGGSCSIGDGCEIGLGAIILPGVVIGNNCVIAAGAVVRKNIEDDSVFISHDFHHNKEDKDYIVKSKKREGGV